MPACGERRLDDVGDHADGMLEDLAAFHPQMPDRSGGRGSAVDEELVLVARRRNAGLRPARRGRRWCPRPSAASRTSAPAPSPNSTQVERSFQSRMREKVSEPITSTRLARPPANIEVGGGDRIDEARADRLHVEGKAVPHAEPVLDLDRGRGKGVVRRRGREHDQVDVGRRQAGIGRAPRARPPRRARRSSRRRRRCGAGECRCAGRSTRRTSRPCPRSRCSS